MPWLDDLAAAAMVLDRTGGVLASNDELRSMLAGGAETLDGAGFASALFDDDDRTLLRSATSAATDRVERVLVRHGKPPCRFLELAMRSRSDGTIAVVVTDRTEEHRLDDALGAFKVHQVFTLDADGQLTWRPPGNAKRLGISDDETVGADATKWIHPEDLPIVFERFVEVLERPGAQVETTVRAFREHFVDTWYFTTLTAINRLDDPVFGGVLVQSAEVYPEEKVHSIEDDGQFMSLAEVAPVGILAGDRRGRISYRNELAAGLIGEAASDEHAVADVIDLDGLTSLADADHRTTVDALIEGVLAGQRGSAVVKMKLPGDRVGWLRIDMVPQFGAPADPVDEGSAGEKRAIGWVASLQDLTAEVEIREELRGAQRRLIQLATHDHLTGLLNRTTFMERVHEALTRVGHDDRSVALLLCDLDRFKPVNDEFGHAVGDVVLVEAARRLEAASSGWGTISRFGGDEFVVLVDAARDDVSLERLRTELVESLSQPIVVDDHTITVGVSVGVARTSDAGLSADRLVQLADDAMYASKRSARPDSAR